MKQFSNIHPGIGRTARTAAAVAVLAVLTTGCGRLVEKATEEAVERAVEKAAESDSGGNVDVEFNEDGISVKSDEGDLTLSVDENGVEIDGTDADGNDFSLDADEDGINAQSEDGSSLDVDADGTFTATDADGDVTNGDVSTDGDRIDFTVEGEDGGSVFNSGPGIPDEWPSDVPRPDDLDEINGTYISDGGTENLVVTGTTSDGAETAFADYAERLTDAGYEEQSKLNQGRDFYSGTFTKGGRTVSVTAQATDGTSNVVISVS